MKKLLSLMLILVLSLGLLAACGGDGDKTDSASNGDASVEVHFSNATVNYFTEDGKCNYRIVRPDENDAMFNVSGTVFKAVKEKLETNIQNTADTSKNFSFGLPRRILRFGTRGCVV